MTNPGPAAFLSFSFGKQTALIKPTGVQIDSGVGFPFVTAWAPLDTGSSVTYSDLNTGTNVTWTRAA